MFNKEKLKCLTSNNRIIYSLFAYGKSHKRVDFPKTLKQLKAYKVCFENLGYIASGTLIYEDRSPIMGIVNGGINSRGERKLVLSKKRLIPRERVLLYCMGKWQTLEKYYNEAVLHYMKTGKLYIDKAIHTDSQYYICEFLRCMRKGLLPKDKEITKRRGLL